tara:strand:+ start:108 stop:1226 length:1119 start_codon:yes stop_codon:yes gene_type:complete
MKKIAIIGAGVSGLFFANLLKSNSNYDFTIFEKNTSVNMENGYGIQLSPNSVKLLNEIGFKNLDINNFFNPKKISFINAKDNKKICDLDISKFNDYNNHYTTLKRSTLLKFLFDGISKEKIMFNTHLKKLNFKNKINLSFNQNYKKEFDYLVVSDGVFSNTKSIIFNKEIKPKYYNSLALRGNINNYPSDDISLYFGPNFHFAIYPINKKKEYNFILIVKKKLLDKKIYKDEDFLKSITKELYKKTDVKLDGKLNNLKSFPIYISQKLEVPDKKNIFFLGDALFTMPPSFAQGASQSIESSKELFDQIINNKDTYYKKRIKKINSIHWRSKLNYFSFQLSNPMLIFFRNFILKRIINNNRFLDSYLGKIYKN